MWDCSAFQRSLSRSTFEFRSHDYFSRPETHTTSDLGQAEASQVIQRCPACAGLADSQIVPPLHTLLAGQAEIWSASFVPCL